MLIGNNHMEINQATLMRILQEWYDRHAPALGVKVTNVSFNEKIGSNTLRVTLEPKEQGVQFITHENIIKGPIA